MWADLILRYYLLGWARDHAAFQRLQDSSLQIIHWDMDPQVLKWWSRGREQGWQRGISSLTGDGIQLGEKAMQWMNAVTCMWLTLSYLYAVFCSLGLRSRNDWASAGLRYRGFYRQHHAEPVGVCACYVIFCAFFSLLSGENHINTTLTFLTIASRLINSLPPARVLQAHNLLITESLHSKQRPGCVGQLA